MPSWKKIVVSGSDATLNSLFVLGAVTASVFSGSSHIGSHTGSLLGTASFSATASNALKVDVQATSGVAIPMALLSGTTSYAIVGYSSGFTYNDSLKLINATASYASTASYLNPLNQGPVIVSGNLYISASGASSSLLLGGGVTSSAENVLVVGYPASGVGQGEGGQISLQAPNSGGYTSASMIDNYQNLTRLLRGTNAGSDAVVAQFNMHTKQFELPTYNSLGAFSGTPVAALGVDSTGKVITIQTGSQTGGGGTTINNNTDNYILTATGTANTINGEANLQFNGSTLSVTGNVSATSITSSGAFIAQANGAMYFRGGDDAELWDINVVNTVGLYGQQDQAVGGIKLGSNGGTLTGRSGSIGVGTTTPSNTVIFDVAGNANISGSLLATGSFGLTGSFSVTGSTIINTQQNTDVDIGTEVVATVPIANTYGAFFDYTVTDLTNYRAGTVMSVWNTAGTVQYTDNSTPDIGDTSGVTFAVVVSGNNAELRATVTTNNWNIKTFVRSI